MSKLTVRKVETLRQPGMFGDGDGLYLRVGPTGGKSWILRTVVHGKRRDLGLGSASLVPLKEARETARSLRKVARSGGDPDTLRKRESLTFEEAARRVHASLLPTWRAKRHGEHWIGALERYAFPQLGTRPLETIGTADVLRVLEPIWTDKPETAKRLKQRISTVFDWAKGAGHYSHENPINGLKKALPVVKPNVEHMAALPWQDIPGFMAELAQRDEISARALEFVILTAARSSQARGALWSEIEGTVWTVPGPRMKGGRQHRVPLCDSALAVLDRVRGLHSDLVFPSPYRTRSGKDRQLAETTFGALLKRMGRPDLTTHGFRSSFRDWASDWAHAEREVAEVALAHSVGSSVEQAYARSDLFERRRKLMDAWGRFCAGEQGAVVQMVRG
jgi:integrase